MIAAIDLADFLTIVVTNIAALYALLFKECCKAGEIKAKFHY